MLQPSEGSGQRQRLLENDLLPEQVHGLPQQRRGFGQRVLRWQEALCQERQILLRQKHDSMQQGGQRLLRRGQWVLLAQFTELNAVSRPGASSADGVPYVSGFVIDLWVPAVRARYIVDIPCLYGQRFFCNALNVQAQHAHEFFFQALQFQFSRMLFTGAIV